MALAGSLLLTVSTLAFALAPNVIVLDLARGLQGCAAGITWAASMAWLSANTPRDRLGDARPASSWACSRRAR